MGVCGWILFGKNGGNRAEILVGLGDRYTRLESAYRIQKVHTALGC